MYSERIFESKNDLGKAADDKNMKNCLIGEDVGW